jgi:hypothetical protein
MERGCKREAEIEDVRERPRCKREAEMERGCKREAERM